jgi:hypothetical protein
MDSINLRGKFNPEELELIDRVYAVTCAYIEARDLYEVATTDTAEQDALRQMMFAVAASTPLDFDALCDRVLVSMDNFRARRVAQN